MKIVAELILGEFAERLFTDKKIKLINVENKVADNIMAGNKEGEIKIL